LKKGIPFPVDDCHELRIKNLSLVNRLSIFCFLDNCAYRFTEPAFECLAAAGVKKKISLKAGEPLKELDSFLDEQRSDWIFGHLGYELMSATGTGNTGKPDGIGFEDLYFFVPDVVLKLEKHQ